MSFIDTPQKRKDLQQALKDHQFYNGDIDGVLGPQSAAAIIKARSVFQLSHQGDPVVDTDLMRELGLLTIQDPVVVGAAAMKGIDLLGLLKALSFLQQVSKGKLMDGTKPWYQSQTIWAGALTVLSVGLSFFHVNFGAADQADAISAIMNLVAGASGLWAIISRIRASKAIGK